MSDEEHEKVRMEIAEAQRKRSVQLQEAEEALGNSTEFLVLVNSYQHEPLDRREQALNELARFCVGFVEKRLSDG